MEENLNLLVACFSAIAASCAAFATFLGWIENRKLRKAQTEPFVDIKLEVMPESISWIRLKISNLGLSPALKLKFEFRSHEFSNEKVAEKVIDIFTTLRFMREGLNYLSHGDSRYSNFVNLLENTEARGFDVKEFLNTTLIVRVEYKDRFDAQYSAEFIIAMNELEGDYRIGESFGDQIIEQLKNTNMNLINLKTEHQMFRNEFEKTHRDWTEIELEQKLAFLKKQRAISESLRQSLENVKYQKVDNKPSIHQLRKKMK